MFLLLRISISRWYNHEEHPWLSQDSSHADGIQAAALSDLRSEKEPNTVSVWGIENDRSNLELVVTALAANRDKIRNFDYALFNLDHILKFSIKIEPTEGNTPCPKVNSWHRNLTELSVHKITELVKIIMVEAERVRIDKKTVHCLIQRAVDAGECDRTKLNNYVQAELS